MLRHLAGFPVAPVKSAGLDPEVLAEFRQALTRETDELKSLSGAAHVVLHEGKCVFGCAAGRADQEASTPFTFDTICRLHGATKPLVCAAFLTLVDAGKCRLSDPVAKYVPFSDKVRERHCVSAKAKKTRKGGGETPARRIATLRDLLTNMAGMDDTEDKKAHAAEMRGIRRGVIRDLSGLCSALSEGSLQSTPGTRYAYGLSIDVLGRVCEVLSGMPLDKFMEKCFLKPMGMHDTHFAAVPSRKRKRVAVLYNTRRVAQKRRDSDTAPYALTPYDGAKAPGIFSSGGYLLSYADESCMWSTVRDQARFCQMILDGGVAPGGRRVLKKTTVKSLWNDALAPFGGRDGRLPGWHDSDGPEKGGWWDYRGLSLIHSFLDLDTRPPRNHKPRRSTSMWFSGGGGAYWTINTARKLVTVSFTQTFGGREDESDGNGPLACRIAPYV